MREVATLVCVAGILFLFRLDRAGAARVSAALWLPIAWTFLASSRMVSEWLGSAIPETPEALLDGSPLDRLVVTALLVVGLGVLLRRGPRVAAVLRANGPVVVFFLWAAFSVLWSDYPDVAFKRWIKACGNVVMVLIVLTDVEPAAALRRYLARLAFLLIPLSILLIRYYPDLGRQYNRWTWTPSYTGVATSKNSLGILCLVFGLASLWRVLEARRPSTAASETPSARVRRRALLAHGVIVGMAVWLFLVANSVTTMACFVVSGALMVALGRRSFSRTPSALHMIVVLGLVMVLCGVAFGDVVTAMLGGRTCGAISGTWSPTPWWAPASRASGSVTVWRACGGCTGGSRTRHTMATSTPFWISASSASSSSWRSSLRAIGTSWRRSSTTPPGRDSSSRTS
jgi:exopolysaccharide production protein ExoQ